MSFSPPFAEYTKEITSIVSQLPHIFTTYAKSLLDEYVIEVINDPQLLFKLLITFSSHKIDQKTSLSLKQLKDFRNKTEHGKFISKETVVRGFLHLQLVFDSFHKKNSNLEWKLGVDKSEIKIVLRKWENILLAVGIKVKEVTIDDKNYIFSSLSSPSHFSSSSPQKPQNYYNKSTDPETPQKFKKNKWEHERKADSSDDDSESEDSFPREHFRKDYSENIYFSPKVKENSFNYEDFTPFSPSFRMSEEKINVKKEVKLKVEEKERSYSSSSSSDSSAERSSSSSSSSNRGSKEKGRDCIRDTIRNLKAKYQAAIKNIPLVIEDGKYKGKEGKIIGFNGTNVWMLLEGEPNKIAIPLERQITLQSAP